MFYKKIKDIPSFKAGDATILREVLHPKNEAGLSLPYSLAEARLEAGTASHPHQLQHSSELYIIQSGRGEAVIDGQVFELEAGTVVLVPENATQFVRNTADEPLVFWCVVAPPWSEDQEIVDTESAS